MRTTVLIVAAGSGTRLQAGVPKALATLADGRTLLEHCLQSVAAAATAGSATAGPATPVELDAVVVVVPADPEAAASLEHVCGLVAERTGLPIRCVPGGAERSDSVRAGLAAIRASDAPTAPPARHAVLVHDAARPFVPPAVFHAVVTALGEGAAAVVPAVPVVDTIKTAAPQKAGDVGPERVSGTLDRSGLRAVQTPQGFELAALQEAHRRAAEAGPAAAAALTDDAMAVEAAGHAVVLVPGDPLSFKVTTPLDLVLANALLGRAPAAPAPVPAPAPEALEDHP